MGAIDVSATVVTLEQTPAGLWCGRFVAMACPCEVLVDCSDQNQARQLVEIAANEAWRIERQYSRYRPDNTIHQINHAEGMPCEVDPELASLLNYADVCYRLSEGLFDITSGVLRRVWSFNGSAQFPADQAISAILPLVGWGKATWQSPHLQLLAGMEIDLGGIGKEYAVDRALALMGADTPVLINFGGDLAANQAQRNQKPWVVAIEDPQKQQAGSLKIQLSCGAITTSGDSRRFILRDGVRYSHILNPKTGWPVVGSPRSVTVLANTCLEAGFLSTLAMLQGAGAEVFLQEQGIEHWVIR